MRAENKVFFSYVIPSVLAFALSGVYTVVDGFFIGRSMGDAGLAAIAVGFPIAAFIQAVGTGIGLAGAIRFTILAAQNKERQKRECFTETVLLMLFASFLLTVIFYFATERILLLFGAKGKIQTLSAEYVRVIVLGSVFQLTATGTVPFIRNMNGAAFAMFSMILGFLANIVLDYALVWVFPFGMAGAAAATVIGQAITLLCAAAFFVKKKCRPRFSRAAEMFTLWGQVLKVSVSPFGLNFSPQLTLLFMNRFLLTYGNAQSVAVFGCIGYVLSVIYFLIQGVGDGSQPLISDRYGRKDVAGVRAVRTKAYLFAAALTAVCMTVMFLTREKTGVLFGASADANAEIVRYLPWFLATLPFLCFTRITTTYFYAAEKDTLSYILVYAEPLCTLLLLCLLPLRLNLTGVWLAVPLTQTMMFAAAVKLRMSEKTAKNRTA